MAIKPILFNTEMVRAILDGRKSCTRRIVKHDVEAILNSPFHKENPDVEDKQIISKLCMPPYQPGDILYVRETWCKYTKRVGKGEACYLKEFYGYKASIANSEDANEPWKPSIYMPKEAARIWLKVTDVRVELLQEITEKQACMEGTDPWDEACYENNGWHPTLSDPDSGGDPNMVDGFHKLWNSTIKKSDLDHYGWNANPWVWVIEFERCENPEEN